MRNEFYYWPVDTDSEYCNASQSTWNSPGSFTKSITQYEINAMVFAFRYMDWKVIKFANYGEFVKHLEEKNK